MAPKPPPAKGPAPAKQPQRPPTKLELCLSSYNFATVGVLLLFSLFLYTLWYISLCAVEKAKRDPLRHAVAQIRQYMISRDAEYGSLNDTAVILEAEKVSRQLLPWAEKIKEIQAEIADIHYKLNHKWMSYKGHLYLLSFDSVAFYDTVKLCNQSKAYVADVQDDEEEAFLEAAIKHKHGSYFIGLVYSNREWTWHHTEGKALNTYWMRGEPKSKNTNKCARLANECNTKLKCWYTVPCSLQGRGICKKKPEDKWIN